MEELARIQGWQRRRQWVQDCCGAVSDISAAWLRDFGWSLLPFPDRDLGLDRLVAERDVAASLFAACAPPLIRLPPEGREAHVQGAVDALVQTILALVALIDDLQPFGLPGLPSRSLLLNWGTMVTRGPGNA